MRNEETSMVRLQELATLVTEQLTFQIIGEDFNLPLQKKVINTPVCEDLNILTLDFTTDVLFVPILRAGNELLQGARNIYPLARTGYLGFQRDSKGEPSCYCEKIPDNLEHTFVIILEPMCATGGTIINALYKLEDHGAKRKNIAVISLFAVTATIEMLKTEFPGVIFKIAQEDPILTEDFYVFPGVGDAGDRLSGVIKEAE
jgi:uracil phosphoribosyltransferase